MRASREGAEPAAEPVAGPAAELVAVTGASAPPAAAGQAEAPPADLAGVAPPADLAGVARVYMAANAVGLVVTLGGVPLGLGWVSATLAAGFGLVLLSAFIVRAGFPRASVNLWLFGLFAGFAELLADAWLVRDLGVLVYADGGPFVAASPLYMPFAWGGMLEAGVLGGGLLVRRHGRVAACALMALAIGVYLPLYEHLAHVCGWWVYRDTPMFLGTVPWFIALGEVLVGAPLPLLARWLQRAGHVHAALAGAAVGLWIFGAYAIAWAICG